MSQVSQCAVNQVSICCPGDCTGSQISERFKAILQISFFHKIPNNLVKIIQSTANNPKLVLISNANELGLSFDKILNSY